MFIRGEFFGGQGLENVIGKVMLNNENTFYVYGLANHNTLLYEITHTILLRVYSLITNVFME